MEVLWFADAMNLDTAIFRRIRKCYTQKFLRAGSILCHCAVTKCTILIFMFFPLNLDGYPIYKALSMVGVQSRSREDALMECAAAGCLTKSTVAGALTRDSPGLLVY